MRSFLTVLSMLVTNEREGSKGHLLTSSVLDIAKINFVRDIGNCRAFPPFPSHLDKVCIYPYLNYICSLERCLSSSLLGVQGKLLFVFHNEEM